MPAHLARDASNDLVEHMRLERKAFAAKIRMTRALIGWSQTELAQQVGLTQRCVHKLEQGDTEPRRSTVYVIEQLWQQQGIEFDDLADGGFRLRARPEMFMAQASAFPRRTRRPAGAN
jgi:ribosome-binding protein aMBF1 (putative translation factor)